MKTKKSFYSILLFLILYFTLTLSFLPHRRIFRARRQLGSTSLPPPVPPENRTHPHLIFYSNDIIPEIYAEMLQAKYEQDERLIPSQIQNITSVDYEKNTQQITDSINEHTRNSSLPPIIDILCHSRPKPHWMLNDSLEEHFLSIGPKRVAIGTAELVYFLQSHFQDPERVCYVRIFSCYAQQTLDVIASLSEIDNIVVILVGGKSPLSRHSAIWGTTLFSRLYTPSALAVTTYFLSQPPAVSLLIKHKGSVLKVTLRNRFHHAVGPLYLERPFLNLSYRKLQEENLHTLVAHSKEQPLSTLIQHHIDMDYGALVKSLLGQKNEVYHRYCLNYLIYSLALLQHQKFVRNQMYFSVASIFMSDEIFTFVLEDRREKQRFLNAFDREIGISRNSLTKHATDFAIDFLEYVAGNPKQKDPIPIDFEKFIKNVRLFIKSLSATVEEYQACEGRLSSKLNQYTTLNETPILLLNMLERGLTTGTEEFFKRANTTTYLKIQLAIILKNSLFLRPFFSYLVYCYIIWIAI